MLKTVISTKREHSLSLFFFKLNRGPPNGLLNRGAARISSVLFLFTVFSLKWDLRRAQEEEDEIRPLLPESAAFKRQGKP